MSQTATLVQAARKLLSTTLHSEPSKRPATANNFLEFSVPIGLQNIPDISERITMVADNSLLLRALRKSAAIGTELGPVFGAPNDLDMGALAKGAQTLETTYELFRQLAEKVEAKGNVRLAEDFQMQASDLKAILDVYKSKGGVEESARNLNQRENQR